MKIFKNELVLGSLLFKYQSLRTKPFILQITHYTLIATLILPSSIFAIPHPADSNIDNSISISEVTAYGTAWKNGTTWPVAPNPIPIGYITNAGSLWKNGERYHDDPSLPAPSRWVSGEEPSGVPGTVVAAMNIPNLSEPLKPDSGTAVTVDRAGNIIVAGTLRSKLYLAKLSPSRQILWQLSFENNGDVRAVTTDQAGNIYFTGNFPESVYFDSAPPNQAGVHSINTAGGHDTFIAKVSPNGTHLWIKRFGGAFFWVTSVYEAGNAIAVAPDGDIVIGGMFCGKDANQVNGPVYLSDLGGGSLPFGGGYTDAFLMKLSAENGNLRWAKSWGTNFDEAVNSLAIDTAGNIFITGNYQSGGITLGQNPLPAVGHMIFLAKFSSSGNHIWSKGFGSPANGSTTGDNQGRSVALDPNGDVVMTGTYGGGGVDFGDGVLPTAQNSDIFLTKYSKLNGDHIWSKKVSESHGCGKGLAIESNGNIFLVGGATRGGSIVTGSFTSSGVPRWYHRISNAYSHANAVALHSPQRAFVIGTFNDPIDFGPPSTPLASTGSTDIFLADIVP